MSSATLWWVMFGITVGLELATGTFVLLMLASGMAVAALLAHWGASFSMQMLAAGVVDAVAVLGWYVIRKSHPQPPSAQANRDVNMDIGEIVQVDGWQPNKTTTVKYRGSQWIVASVPGQALETGEHRIVEIVGNRLIVEKI